MNKKEFKQKKIALQHYRKTAALEVTNGTHHRNKVTDAKHYIRSRATPTLITTAQKSNTRVASVKHQPEKRVRNTRNTQHSRTHTQTHRNAHTHGVLT